MTLKNKRLGTGGRRLERDNELDGPQKDSIELSNLIFSFQKPIIGDQDEQ
jgi:hypothetical protein